MSLMYDNSNLYDKVQFATNIDDWYAYKLSQFVCIEIESNIIELFVFKLNTNTNSFIIFNSDC